MIKNQDGTRLLAVDIENRLMKTLHALAAGMLLATT
jgi:hypothetical protein